MPALKPVPALKPMSAQIAQHKFELPVQCTVVIYADTSFEAASPLTSHHWLDSEPGKTNCNEEPLTYLMSVFKEDISGSLDVYICLYHTEGRDIRPCKEITKSAFMPV